MISAVFAIFMRFSGDRLCIKDVVLIDPACGTGGMLIEAIHHMHNDRLSYGRIFGQESNMSTSAIAQMNLYLHGAKDVQIMHGDT